MKKYYFTFGQSHKNIQGEEMKDFYVIVHASDYGSARELFIEWSSIHLSEKNQWAFQYEEKDFNKSLYPKGAYETIFEEQI